MNFYQFAILVVLLGLSVQVSSSCPADLSFRFIYFPTGPVIEPNGTLVSDLDRISEGKAGQQVPFSGGEGFIFVIEESEPFLVLNGTLSMSEICTRLDNNNQYWHCEGVFEDLSHFGCNGFLSYEGFYAEFQEGTDLLNIAEFALTGGTNQLEGFKGVVKEQEETFNFLNFTNNNETESATFLVRTVTSTAA